MPNREYLVSIEEVIAEARAGRMFFLVDDEKRENEGDLVIPAEKTNADSINFMAKHGRGLICLSLTAERVTRLGLGLMSPENASRHHTAFTVSIEAREGVTTGISAADRARTIAVAIDGKLDAKDIVSPGHIFPLKAREGGVLVRTGHTEAAVDISRLAGLTPAGVICEIMNDDGTMARMPDLVAFAQRHNLKIGTIADLIAYRLRHDRIVHQRVEGNFKTLKASDIRTIVYANDAEATEHIALVKGNLNEPGAVLVRMHAFNIFDDIFSVQKTIELHRAMELIDNEGRGVIVMIRSSNPTVLSDRLRQSIETQEHPRTALREYGVGAQILLDLGVHEMILLSSTVRSIVGLEAYGLTIVEQRPITIPKDYVLPVRDKIYG